MNLVEYFALGALVLAAPHLAREKALWLSFVFSVAGFAVAVSERFV